LKGAAKADVPVEEQYNETSGLHRQRREGKRAEKRKE